MSKEITIPNNWRPRKHQLKAWRYLQDGGSRALLIWHRRAGKDDVALHMAASKAVQRVGNYWHMLPEQAQARKAIWNAVNPHTGLRRIDEAFPESIRKRTLDQEMMIELVNGSIWQVLGSDNYNSLVGSPPVGLVASEWALAKPEAWAYLRPILLENGGWAMFITTARGKNHAYTMLQAAKGNDDWFTEILPANDTDVFTAQQLASERQEYVKTYGEGVGLALFNQEYYCSFDSAVVGSIYGEDIEKARMDKRIGEFPYRKEHLVYTFWDLGWGDATAIWFAQIVGQYIHIIDYYENNNKDIAHYIGVCQSKGYNYAQDWLPHDAAHGDLQVGTSVESMMRGMGRNVAVAPRLPVNDSISAAHLIFPRCRFDAEKCEKGIEALQNYHWDYNTDLGVSSRKPVHDWSSHGADAFEVLAVAADQLDKHADDLSDYSIRRKAVRRV